MDCSVEPQIKQIWIYILSQIGSIYLQFQHSRGGRIMNLRPGLKKHLIYQCTCEFNVISIGRDKTGEDRGEDPDFSNQGTAAT